MRMRFSPVAAFSLVEVTLALGVAGFCLVAIFGLLPVALNSNQAAIQQTVADSILTAVVSDLRATPVTSPAGAAATSAQYAIAIPANGSTVSPAQTLYFISEQQPTSTATLAHYLVTVTFFANTPSSTWGSRSATALSVKVTWPVVGTPSGAVQTFTALDRN